MPRNVKKMKRQRASDVIKKFQHTCYFPPANLVPISNAFSQSIGNISSRLLAFFTGSKRVDSTFE